MQPVRHLILVMLALLGACTMRSAINTMTSEQDRAFAQEMVSRLRSADAAWLEQHFDPRLWEQSGKQVAGAPDLFPREPGTTELIGFHVSTNMAAGRTERTKEFSLVTHGGGRWTVTHFRTYSTGGPDKVVQWSVTPHDAPPPELTMIETWDAAVPWIWAALVTVLAGVVALIVWLVRRSRRNREALMGGAPGVR
ncbi:MAG: hypothetical protein M3177_04965 [Pseudomonadota bacterium]|nr:hypothetical protein [Pseudomonadota bacterium]